MKKAGFNIRGIEQFIDWLRKTNKTVELSPEMTVGEFALWLIDNDPQAIGKASPGSLAKMIEKLRRVKLSELKNDDITKAANKVSKTAGRTISSSLKTAVLAKAVEHGVLSPYYQLNFFRRALMEWDGREPITVIDFAVIAWLRKHQGKDVAKGRASSYASQLTDGVGGQELAVRQMAEVERELFNIDHEEQDGNVSSAISDLFKIAIEFGKADESILKKPIPPLDLTSDVWHFINADGGSHSVLDFTPFRAEEGMAEAAKSFFEGLLENKDITRIFSAVKELVLGYLSTNEDGISFKNIKDINFQRWEVWSAKTLHEQGHTDQTQKKYIQFAKRFLNSVCSDTSEK
jgi:hypothetical protein